MEGNGGGRCGVEMAVEGACKECVGGRSGGHGKGMDGPGGKRKGE